MVRYGMKWFGMVRYDTLWCRMVRYDMGHLYTSTSLHSSSSMSSPQRRSREGSTPTVQLGHRLRLQSWIRWNFFYGIKQIKQIWQKKKQLCKIWAYSLIHYVVFSVYGLILIIEVVTSNNYPLLFGGQWEMSPLLFFTSKKHIFCMSGFWICRTADICLADLMLTSVT